MKSNNELKFLLTLLGCPNYRSLYADRHFDKFQGKAKLCQDLADRGWLNYTREIASVKLSPAGKALLKLDPDQLPIEVAALKVLEKIAQSPTKVKVSSLGIKKASDRQPILQRLSDRGLIEVETQIAKKAEIWLTEQALEYLREDYHPKGKQPVISLDLLNNYLQFLRKSPSVEAQSVTLPQPANSSAEMSDGEILEVIKSLDSELGTENYLPLFHLRQYVSLSRNALDQALYRLQRNDQIELGSLEEVSAYTAEQIDAGIPQNIGGPLFFITVIE